MGGLLLGGRGRLTSAAHRRKAIELIGEANAAGAGLVSACREIGICLRTLKRWRRAFVGDGDGKDRRKGSPRLVVHRLSEEERQRILLTCNQPEYASLPPGQIVPALADQGLFIGSESSFYRVLHQAGQCHRRGRARLPQEPRSVPRLMADRPNALWSWDISFLPTTVRGVWLYLYLVVDVWSRKVVAWDVAEVESAEIAGGSGAAGLSQGALPTAQRLWQPPVPAATTDPPRRQRQCHARGDAGNASGGDGSAQILFQAKGLKRQPLLRIPVPYGQVPA